MSNLKESIDIQCPAFYAMHHAQRFFALRRRDHVPGMLTLRVDFSSLKLPGTSEARHDVAVKHELTEEHGTKKLALSWDPQDRTVPRFAGSLHVTEKEPGTAILTLEGTYTPPLGVPGAAFDLVAGRKIASATAHALLEDIREFIEADYRTARATNLASSPKD